MGNDDETCSERIFFAEYGQALDCIDRIVDSQQQQAAASSLEEFRRLLDPYQEAPTLLDPYLEILMSRLGKHCEESIINDRGDFLPFSFSVIYFISKVRGRKQVVQFLPHGVHLIEPVLSELRRRIQQDNDTQQTTELPASWESIYVLWMWVGALSLTPFGVKAFATDSTSFYSSLSTLARESLAQAGAVRDVAAVALASWLARPSNNDDNVTSLFQEFATNYALPILSKQGNNKDQYNHTSDIFLVLGVVQTLADFLKRQPRCQIPTELISHLWKLTSSSHTLLRKFVTKSLTRIACGQLPPQQVCSWRYLRGKRQSLLENLQADTNKASHEETGEERQKVNDDDDLFLFPDLVEDVMGHLIESLEDSSTAVRWSAAKGIGRLTERLPRLCAHDVLDAIIRAIEGHPEKDSVWHGACLALGELARRGLLLSERLHEVIPILIKAVQVSLAKWSSLRMPHTDSTTDPCSLTFEKAPQVWVLTFVMQPATHTGPLLVHMPQLC